MKVFYFIKYIMQNSCSGINTQEMKTRKQSYAITPSLNHAKMHLVTKIT